MRLDLESGLPGNALIEWLDKVQAPETWEE